MTPTAAPAGCVTTRTRRPTRVRPGSRARRPAVMATGGRFPSTWERRTATRPSSARCATSPMRHGWTPAAAPSVTTPFARGVAAGSGRRCPSIRRRFSASPWPQSQHRCEPEPEPARPSKVKGDAPPGDDLPGRALSPPPTLPSDSFSHPRHKKLACLTCHLSTSGQKLTFEPPRGCQICHHQDPLKADCTKCHEQGSLPEIVAVPVSIAAAGKPARERTVSFRHEKHTDLKCTACHGQAVTWPRWIPP